MGRVSVIPALSPAVTYSFLSTLSLEEGQAWQFYRHGGPIKWMEFPSFEKSVFLQIHAFSEPNGSVVTAGRFLWWPENSN